MSGTQKWLIKTKLLYNYYDVLPNVFTLILLCLFCIDELFTAA